MAWGMLGLAVALALGAGIAAAPYASPQAAKPAAPAADEKKAEFKGDVYALDTCLVTGKKLGSMGAPVVKSYDGREVRFCCEACVPKFEADQAKYLKRLDEELVSQQSAHYPLTHCVVMEDDPLEGVHDETAQLVYRNRLVKFCCKDCIKDFNADPATYIAKLDKAVIEQQSEKYPLKTCPVSGEELGGMGEPVNYVVGTTLVKFCCASCVKSFQKDPLPTIKKVHDAWAAMHKDGGHDNAEKPATAKP
jgi:YHS domain-containing protein